MADLRGTVAVVTGASRGVGRGVALGLGEAGAVVYVTGRTRGANVGPTSMPGSVTEAADEVTRVGEAAGSGGRGVAVPCDHADDRQTAALFDRVRADHGRLDLLVNSAWGGYEHFNDGTEFWNEREFWTVPLSRWDRMFVAGVRAAYVCASHAAKLMVERRAGLIVNVSSFAAERVRPDVSPAYGVAHAAMDQLATRFAAELKAYGIAAVSVYPGLVRTEAVMKAAEWFGDKMNNSESPQYVGRVIAALAADPGLLEKTGRAHVIAELGATYGVVDVDGRVPRSLRDEA